MQHRSSGMRHCTAMQYVRALYSLARPSVVCMHVWSVCMCVSSGAVCAAGLTDDAVPCGVVFLVELLLDVCGHVSLDAILGQCGGGNIDRLLLHLLRHVRILDHSTTQIRHRGHGTDERREGKGRKEKGRQARLDGQIDDVKRMECQCQAVWRRRWVVRESEELSNDATVLDER